MSKVKIDIDTKTGELNLSVDGEEFENVSCVNAYCYEYSLVDEAVKKVVDMYVELKSEKMGDFRKLVRLVTANSSYASKNADKKTKAVGDLLLIETNEAEDLSQAASDWLNK